VITRGDNESYIFFALSVASLYGCKPNLKNLHVFDAFVIQVFGWCRPVTETTGIILMCLDDKYA